MEIAVIEISMGKLQKLHDSGAIHPSDYTAIEVFEKGFKEDPEYTKLILQKKEAYSAFKKKEKEIEDQINNLRNEYNSKQKRTD